ncbi:MAG TPA: hypothetical protein VI942_00125, partial [Thermoanaerobaculia bacterium]|nr:hypothetical protein [Thermoanaerobaculia bacterium]
GEYVAARPEAAMMWTATLDAMARGGICDQLGGGFHRYATDREWRVPHFEKMLYDNGLLLELYAAEHARTGNAEAGRVARETAGWLGREMTAPEGAFWSAIDAETDGHEGAYYVWKRRELDAALGAEDAEFLAPILGFGDEPFFEHDAYVLHLPRPLEVQARERRTSREALLAEIDPLRRRLLAARSMRQRPATDDKVLSDWNGTAIAGLAAAGTSLGAPELLERAARAAEFLLGSLRAEDGTLLHAWRAGSGRVAAFLSDYVFLGRGLLRLHAATGERRWLDEAIRLQEEQERRLASPRGGYFNAAESDDLLFRSKELFDGAMPAANGVAALHLLELRGATGEGRFLDAAERTLRAFAPIVSTHPDAARTIALALARFALVKSSEVASTVGGAGGAAAVAPRKPAARAGGEGGAVLEGLEVELGEPADERGFRAFRLRMRLKDGWHLAIEGGLPRLEGSGATLERMEWPTARPLGEIEGEAKVPGFAGAVEVRGRVRLEAPRAALLLRFVACGEGRCLPVEEIEIAL